MITHDGIVHAEGAAAGGQPTGSDHNTDGLQLCAAVPVRVFAFCLPPTSLPAVEETGDPRSSAAPPTATLQESELSPSPRIVQGASRRTTVIGESLSHC